MKFQRIASSKMMMGILSRKLLNHNMILALEVTSRGPGSSTANHNSQQSTCQICRKKKQNNFPNRQIKVKSSWLCNSILLRPQNKRRVSILLSFRRIWKRKKAPFILINLLRLFPNKLNCQTRVLALSYATQSRDLSLRFWSPTQMKVRWIQIPSESYPPIY